MKGNPWKEGADGQWHKTENGVLIAVTRTALGDFRAEYRGFRGGMVQIGYYPTKVEAEKQCENAAFGRAISVGRRK